MGLLQEAPLLPPADQPEEAPDGDETSYAHTSGILELSPGIPFPLLPLPLDAAVGGPPPHGEGHGGPSVRQRRRGHLVTKCFSVPYIM